VRVVFKIFDSKMASFEKLFKAAVDYASHIPKEDLINISHSSDKDNIVVAIWYWAEGEVGKTDPKAAIGAFKPPSMTKTEKPVAPTAPPPKPPIISTSHSAPPLPPDPLEDTPRPDGPAESDD
jgi:hypothetical protein